MKFKQGDTVCCISKGSFHYNRIGVVIDNNESSCSVSFDGGYVSWLFDEPDLEYVSVLKFNLIDK